MSAFKLQQIVLLSTDPLASVTHGILARTLAVDDVAPRGRSPGQGCLVVTSDLGDTGGLRTLARWRAQGFRGPAVVAAHGVDLVRARFPFIGNVAGVDFVFTKPWDVSRLVEATRMLLPMGRTASSMLRHEMLGGALWARDIAPRVEALTLNWSSSGAKDLAMAIRAARESTPAVMHAVVDVGRRHGSLQELMFEAARLLQAQERPSSVDWVFVRSVVTEWHKQVVETGACLHTESR